MIAEEREKLQSIRVAVEKLPRLLQEIIVSSLSPQRDFDLIDLSPEGRTRGPSRVLAGIDVLMTSSDGARLSAENERLLWSQPLLRILVIESGGRHAALYELRTHRINFSEITVDRLAESIRATFSEPRTIELAETDKEH